MKSYLGLGCVAALLLTACGDDEKEFVEYVNPCASIPAGQRGVDASVRRAFESAEKAGKVMVDDTWSARADSPRTDTGRISASIPPTWAIRANRSLARSGAGSAPVAPARAARGGAPASPGRAATAWGRVRAAFTVPAAHAASCAPANGELYLLRIVNPRDVGRVAYTAILSVDEYVPEADVWRAAMDLRIGQTLEVTVLRAAFKDGAIVQGPWAPTKPTSYLVTP